MARSGEVGMRRRFGAALDGITIVGFYCATVCLAVITFVYIYEVGARYFFSAPTSWASAIVSYMLIYTVFLAMPELTRQRVHVFISIFLDSLPARHADLVLRSLYTIAGVACLLGAYFSFDTTVNQFLNGVTTVTEWRVEKWLVSAAIPYGLLFTGLHYLRHVASGVQYNDGRVS